MRVLGKVCLALGLGGFAVSGCGGSDSKKEPTFDGTTIEEIAHEAADECDDDKDNDGDGFADCDDLDCRTDAKNDCRFAPVLDRTAPTNLRDATSFLYTAPDPVQKELDQGTLDARRLAVIHGRVINRKGKALRDVRVDVKDHPELGYSMSRSDGRYDLVVNGGGVVVLEYERQGYVGAERSVATEWQREHVAADVGLVTTSNQVHVVRAGKGQVVRARQTKDDYGTRQPFLVFDKGTEADLLLSGGEHKQLSELHLRVTEYPFDTETPPMPGGSPRFLPGSLPSSGVVTYSLEFAVDEAAEFDATRVEFSKPVAYYVENFLGLPVGSPVPLRSYDPDTSEWEILPAGRVVEVVGVRDGKAQLDTDGDGESDSAKALRKLGVTNAELVELGARFEKGATLWRHQVEHFSTFTDAWNVLAAGKPMPPLVPSVVTPQTSNASWRGSVMVESQVLNESVELAGTGYSLVYQGNRSRGYGAAFRVTVPLLGDVVPAGLNNVCVIIEVAGKIYPEDAVDRCRAPKAKDAYEFVWNGRNVYEQVLQGAQIARVWVGYAFNGTLPADTSLEKPADADSLGLPDSLVWNRQDVPLGVLDAHGYQFGGFGLDVLHAYDPVGEMVYFGDGTQRHADRLHLTIVAMDQTDPGSTASSASSKHVEAPDSIAVAPDGSALVSDDGEKGRVWRILPDGTYETVLGDGASGAAGGVELVGPQGVATDPSDGTLYVVDWKELVIWRLRSGGAVDILLGDDPDAAIRHALENPDGIAVGPNHELYVADANKVWKVWPNQGSLEEPPYVGGVELATNYDLPLDISEVTQANQVPLDETCGVAVDSATGTLFVSSRRTHQVWRIETNGNAFLVAGTGTAGFSGDGLLAIDAELNAPRGLALGKDGSIFIVDQENGRVRRVFPNGQITTVAGGGESYPSTLLPGTEAKLSRPDGLAFGPDGVAYVGGAVNGDEPPHLFRASSPTGDAFGQDEYIVPSSDGQLAYRFSSVGRHLETIRVATGKPALTFKYDSNSRLISVTDADNLETSVSRDGDGRATRVVGPYGHETKLGYATDGNLKTVKAEVDASTSRTKSYEYDPDSSLMSAAETNDGNRFEYKYDKQGRVKDVKGPVSFQEIYSGATVPGTQNVKVSAPGADTDQDTYIREPAGAGLFEGFSFEDRDGQKLSDKEKPDRTFETRLPGGAVVRGVMAASDQWGEQVRYPSESTLTTPGGRRLTRAQTITTTGLSRAADGTVLNPLEYDTQEITVTVNGAVQKRTYDRAAKTLTTTSAEGRVTVIHFDDDGRPVRCEASGSADTVLTYDGDGRLETVTRQADGQSRVTRWHQGADGFVESVTNAAGHDVTYAYDGVGRVTSVTRPGDAVTGYGYDANDNVVSLSPPGRSDHVYVYEKGSSLSKYLPPTGTGTAAAGFIPAEIRYGYDSYTRPSSTTLADGGNIQKQYYNGFYRASQLWVTPGLKDTKDEYYLTYGTDRDVITKIYGPVNGIEFTYDSMLLTKVEPKGPSASGIVNFSYDDFLRLSQIRLTGSTAVPYAYDDDSLLVQAGPLTIARDPQSGLVTGTAVDTITTTETPNGFGELQTYSAAVGGTEVFWQDMERDAMGRVITLAEDNQGVTSTLEYTYDAGGRLSSVTSAGLGTSRYYYDDNGNRYPDAALSGASYDEQDRILSYGSVTFDAIPTGDVVRKNGTLDPVHANGREGYELVYGTLGTLVSASVLGTGDEVTYETDPFGRRVGRKLNGGKPKGWIYSDGLRIIAEIDDNAARTDFVYGTHPTVPALMAKAGKTYRIITDRLGSVRLVVDVATGAVAQRLDYDAWGVVTNDSNPGLQPFGFAGGLYDPATGLVRFGLRDYDPELGRWTTRDPIGLGGGVNVYLYAAGDPANHVDPLGLWVGIDDAVFAGTGALLGIAGRGIGDLLTGSWSSWEDYVGAAVGGAVAGEVLLYTANPFLAGAAGGLSGNLTAQGLKMVTGKQEELDVVSTFVDTGVGALTGFIPGKPRLAGINKGRGSDLQIFRQMVTRAKTGNIRNVTLATARKMANGAYYNWAFGQGATIGAVASTLYSRF